MKKIRFEICLKCPICGKQGLLVFVYENNRVFVAIEHTSGTLCIIERPSDEFIKQVVKELAWLHRELRLLFGKGPSPEL